MDASSISETARALELWLQSSTKEEEEINRAALRNMLPPEDDFLGCADIRFGCLSEIGQINLLASVGLVALNPKSIIRLSRRPLEQIDLSFVHIFSAKEIQPGEPIFSIQGQRL